MLLETSSFSGFDSAVCILPMAKDFQPPFINFKTQSLKLKLLTTNMISSYKPSANSKSELTQGVFKIQT